MDVRLTHGVLKRRLGGADCRGREFGLRERRQGEVSERRKLSGFVDGGRHAWGVGEE